MSADTVRQTGTIAGAWLDRKTLGLPGLWNTYSTQWLPKAFNDGEFLTFAGHMPDWSGRDYSVDPWFLDYFLNFVNEGSPRIFMHMGDLPSDFGSQASLATVDPAAYLSPAGELVIPNPEVGR